jgi:hypothetical protein
MPLGLSGGGRIHLFLRFTGQVPLHRRPAWTLPQKVRAGRQLLSLARPFQRLLKGRVLGKHLKLWLCRQLRQPHHLACSYMADAASSCRDWCTTPTGAFNTWRCATPSDWPRPERWPPGATWTTAGRILQWSLLDRADPQRRSLARARGRGEATLEYLTRSGSSQDPRACGNS